MSNQCIWMNESIYFLHVYIIVVWKLKNKKEHKENKQNKQVNV